MSSKLKAGTSTSGAVLEADTTGILELQTGSTPTTAVTVDTSQNVGIGTTTPDYKLVVDGEGSAGAFALKRTGTLTGSGSFRLVGSSGSEALGFLVNASEKMRVTSAGSLNIGATTGTGRLYVESDVYVARFVATNNTAGTEVITQLNLVASNNATASDYFFIGGINQGADKVYILGNGNLQNVNNSYGTLSDIKLKENIVDATPKLEKILQLKVRNFNLKSDPDLKQIGFVAQELEQIFPSLIEESSELDTDKKFTGEKVKGVKTSVLIPILVKALQELNAKVDAQATTIADQEARLAVLEAK